MTKSGKRVRNSVIRIEVSPAPEHTKDFTIADWEKLWDGFVREFDSIELTGKDGKVYSPKTNLRGSKGQVYLHLESNSGVPHLHAAFCRIDGQGRVNNDHGIHLRAQRAAERVARRRGWTTAMRIHERNIPQVSVDCMEALRRLDRWSWDGYREQLAAKGYELPAQGQEGRDTRLCACQGQHEVQGIGTRKGAQPHGGQD